jgi:hypothetical protein
MDKAFNPQIRAKVEYTAKGLDQRFQWPTCQP